MERINETRDCCITRGSQSCCYRQYLRIGRVQLCVELLENHSAGALAAFKGTSLSMAARMERDRCIPGPNAPSLSGPELKQPSLRPSTLAPDSNGPLALAAAQPIVGESVVRDTAFSNRFCGPQYMSTCLLPYALAQYNDLQWIQASSSSINA